MAERKPSKSEDENLWNIVLSEALTANKFHNSNILLLGNKNTGKRALLNALQDISETEIPTKSLKNL
jgi:tRNA U34 5-carboxymethylaminomethyl modifying GTPase MnmE/TrmE